MKTEKFEMMKKIIRERLPEARKIEILFCSKENQRYVVTAKIDGHMDIQSILNSELKE